LLHPYSLCIAFLTTLLLSVMLLLLLLLLLTVPIMLQTILVMLLLLLQLLPLPLLYLSLCARRGHRVRLLTPRLIQCGQVMSFLVLALLGAHLM